MPLPLPILTILTFILTNTPTASSALFSNKNKNKPKPPPPSLFSRLFPIIVFFTVVTIIAVIIYLTYLTVVSVSSEAHSRLDSNNIKLSRSGADVGLEGVSYEKYRDLTQKLVPSTFISSLLKFPINLVFFFGFGISFKYYYIIYKQYK
ncbi:hypothetical protein AA313_de0209199 [Arthrobotrys entomopaga]|nr:hypothetical protein AA313_de0209199 [Arthrobotrys entomopaga]